VRIKLPKASLFLSSHDWGSKRVGKLHALVLDLARLQLLHSHPNLEPDFCEPYPPTDLVLQGKHLLLLHVVMVLFGQALELRPLEAGSGESIFEVRRLGAVKVTDVVEQFVARLPPVGTASATALDGDAPAVHGTRAGPAVAGCVAPRGAGARKRGRARLCHVRRGFEVRSGLQEACVDGWARVPELGARPRRARIDPKSRVLNRGRVEEYSCQQRSSLELLMMFRFCGMM
jgi:hypothetical protein